MKKLPPKKNESSKKTEFNNPFRLLEKNAGVIKWSGILPATPSSTHFLYCTNLTVPDQFGMRIPKRFEGATHEIRIGYRLNFASRPLSVLFVGQFNFAGKHKMASWLAEKITTSLALYLKDKKTPVRLLLRADDNFWELFIEREFRYLDLPSRY